MLKAGPIVDGDKRDPKLPPEYEQVEYLEMDNDPIIYHELVLPNNQESRDRILVLSNMIPKLLIRPTSYIPQEFSILVPEKELSKVSDDERNNAKLFVDKTTTISSLPPQLIRILEQQYIDDFLDNGNLLLSSYNQCKKLEDPLRKDESEGQAKLICKSGEYTIEIAGGIGNNPFLLCCSNFLSTPDELEDEKGKRLLPKGIIIDDPYGLIDQIIHALNDKGIHISQVLFGQCKYSDRIINRIEDSNPNFITGPNTMDFNAMFEYQSKIMGTDIYFTKGSNFKYEHEWRFVFISDAPQDKESIIIHINSPRTYCHEYQPTTQ